MLRSFSLAAVVTAVHQSDVTVPLRSGPLQWHVQWDSLLALAEASIREEAEAALQARFAELREHVVTAAAQVWASVSLQQLQGQMQRTGWPQSQEVLEMAEAQDLSRLGFVMVSLRHRLSRLEDDWEQMKGAVAEWNSEAERQSLHLPINFGILLKQASVLLGLLSASPGFDSCLGRALEDARRLRPSEALYQSSSAHRHLLSFRKLFMFWLPTFLQRL
ncbi:unnamed protein product [Effrenium voratum]|nr:unnamed protein product [Effrenium voratum]